MEKAWIWAEGAACQWDSKIWGWILMVWGCMTPQGVAYMCKIDGKMDAELYTSIFQDELLETVEFYGLVL